MISVCLFIAMGRSIFTGTQSLVTCSFWGSTPVPGPMTLPGGRYPVPAPMSVLREGDIPGHYLGVPLKPG